MEVKEIESFDGIGYRIRTKNTDEMDPKSAKIGQLWERFYYEIFPKLNNESKVYGIYTNYESDFMGLFDVIASTDISFAEKLPDLVKTRIKSGKYLTFKAKGEIPQVVINLWGEIWSYFNSNSCTHTRAYTTDFEFYKSGDEVEIFISIA